MADDLSKVGKSDRILASLQKHEVAHIAQRFRISPQAAGRAIKAAGPSRKRVYAYIMEKKASATIAGGANRR
jgi:hypothetical protein